jgi:transcriptional regulator with XRE-family HTH domain
MTKKEREKALLKFAGHLKQLREEQGLSIHGLADTAGLEYAQVHRIENGKVNPTLITILKLSEALNIPASDLLNY